MDGLVKFVFLHGLYRNVIARKEACTNAGHTYKSGVGCVDKNGEVVPMYVPPDKKGGKRKRSRTKKYRTKKHRTKKNRTKKGCNYN
jgi:hypothetical protein